jgi:hypothetical protein
VENLLAPPQNIPCTCNLLYACPRTITIHVRHERNLVAIEYELTMISDCAHLNPLSKVFVIHIVIHIGSCGEGMDELGGQLGVRSRQGAAVRRPLERGRAFEGGVLMISDVESHVTMRYVLPLLVCACLLITTKIWGWELTKTRFYRLLPVSYARFYPASTRRHFCVAPHEHRLPPSSWLGLFTSLGEGGSPACAIQKKKCGMDK